MQYACTCDRSFQNKKFAQILRCTDVTCTISYYWRGNGKTQRIYALICTSILTRKFLPEATTSTAAFGGSTDEGLQRQVLDDWLAACVTHEHYIYCGLSQPLRVCLLHVYVKETVWENRSVAGCWSLGLRHTGLTVYDSYRVWSLPREKADREGKHRSFKSAESRFSFASIRYDISPSQGSSRSRYRIKIE